MQRCYRVLHHCDSYMRLTSILVLTLGLFFASSAVFSQQSPKEVKINQLLALTNSDAMLDQVFNQMKAMISAQAPPGVSPQQKAQLQEQQAKIFDLIKNRLSPETLRPQLAKVYDETFTESEVDGMLGFYQSPAGRAMLQKTPMLMGKFMAVVQAQMGDLRPEIERIVKEGQAK